MWDLKNIHKKIYINGKKTVTREFLNNLKELGLAIWFMDDGSICRSKKKTNSFSKDGF